MLPDPGQSTLIIMPVMHHIAFIHYQVGHTDGVSLEIEKWQRVLEEMGHRTHLVAGDLGRAQGTLIPAMHHHRPEARRLYRNTFIALSDYEDERAYRRELFERADEIERELRRALEEQHVDFLIPQNVWSVGVHPSVAIALARVQQDMALPAVAHHHDFYWERPDGVALTCSSAVELADKYLPPRNRGIRHVVINSLAQAELAARKGLYATVVPNIFDFEAPPWQRDDYNADFRRAIGLRENDVLILQATRVIARKGIELAIDFVRALDSPRRRAELARRGLYDGRAFDDDSRIVYVLAGYTRDDPGGEYVRRLHRKIARTGIDALFIEDHVASERSRHQGRKLYSLWDTYVCADLVTYPSLWEGWGNQFLEAVRGRLPIVLFEYPVYAADIKDKGFDVISLGSTISGRDDLGLVQVDPAQIEAAADEAVEVLTDARRRQEMVEHNYALAREHYSLPALRRYLSQLLKS
ncbi:MAG: glycosyltransferase [Chloroflexi bacterium]|nr:MAG: glycosyltransferase [Chloroflexota bacterium]